MSTPAPTRASSGASINHLVLNVRDIEASHRFYTEVIGFEQCGDLTHTMTMRFYRGRPVAPPRLRPGPGGRRRSGCHHPNRRSMGPQRIGVNHFAIGYPDRQSWLDQLRHIKAHGVEFARRGNHGMTHSAYLYDPDGYGIEVVYDVPADVWEGDVDAALELLRVPRSRRPRGQHRLPAFRRGHPRAGGDSGTGQHASADLALNDVPDPSPAELLAVAAAAARAAGVVSSSSTSAADRASPTRTSGPRSSPPSTSPPRRRSSG